MTHQARPGARFERHARRRQYAGLVPVTVAHRPAPSIGAVARVEFTVEPFVDGQPGPHVTAPVDALRAAGFDVVFDAFGTVVDTDPDRVAEVVSIAVGAAIAHGATHVNTMVSADGAEL